MQLKNLYDGASLNGFLIPGHRGLHKSPLLISAYKIRKKLRVAMRHGFSKNSTSSSSPVAASNDAASGVPKKSAPTTCLSTDWISIDPAISKFLTLSGDAFNRAIWQFKLSDGKILNAAPGFAGGGFSKCYRPMFGQKCGLSAAHVEIPENATAVRVYYQWASFEDTSFTDDSETISLPTGKRLCLQYGLIPQSLKHYEEKDPYADYSDVYAVRHALDDADPICERCGASSDFSFNYLISTDSSSIKASPYENSFDKVFPWSDIKKVTINGNEMIEIPKHFVKREIINGYEYTAISRTKHPGFEIDPSFVTKEGVKDFIYISAYQASMDESTNASSPDSDNPSPAIKSLPGRYVNVRRSLDKYKSLAAANSSKDYSFSVLDGCAALTLIRLFLIETATLDSQSIFTGLSCKPFMTNVPDSVYHALEDSSNSNSISVIKSPITARFKVGDCISILGAWKNEYTNSPNFYQRRITSIATDDAHKNRYIIQFDGKSTDIKKGITKITGLPAFCGCTDGVDYHSGVFIPSEESLRNDIFSGKLSFKYRGIENLYGNVWMLLDGTNVKNGKVSFTFPDGSVHSPSYNVPVQTAHISSDLLSSNTDNPMAVKKLGFDSLEPLIALPSVAGSGASLNSYYCCSWTNAGEADKSYVLTYGGAWDNLAHAGLFCFRAEFTSKSRVAYNSCRIMARPL